MTGHWGLHSRHVIWLFPYHGPVSFHESPEHQSYAEHCSQHQESNQHAKDSEERIVEEKDSVFESLYSPCRLIEWDGGLGVIDHQHIAIACIIIPSSIAGRQNGRSKCCICFLFGQARFF